MRTCDAINMSTTKDPAAGIVYGEIWTRASQTGKIDVMIKNTWHRLTRAEAIELRDSLAKTLGRLDNEVCRGCPECKVVFDNQTIYGHVPDNNSSTCRACEHNDRRTE